MLYDVIVDKMSTQNMGGVKVTDTKELQRIIEESGLKKNFIAAKLGLTLYGLQKKVENRSQFKAEEIKILCEVLSITSLREKERIFFACDVDKMPTEEGA